MRHIMIFAITAALTTSPALAGGFAEPAMEPEVIMNPDEVAGQTVSSGGFIIPLLILAVIVAAASSSGGSTPPAVIPLKPLK